MEVWDAAESACEKINRALGQWYKHDAAHHKDKKRVLEGMAVELDPLFDDPMALSTMLGAMGRDDLGQGIGVVDCSSEEPILLKSTGTTNIIFYRGHYYALPQSLGPINFHIQNVSDMAGVLVTSNMNDLILSLKKSSN
jgi:hypothetical protein